MRINQVNQVESQLIKNFSEFLLRIGNGTEGVDNCIQISYHMLENINTLEDFINSIYGNINNLTYEEKIDYLSIRSILATTNDLANDN